MGYYKPSSSLIASADGVIYADNEQKSTSSTSYVKMYELKMNYSCKIKIYFEIKNETSSSTTYAQIKKNDTAIKTFSRKSTEWLICEYYVDVNKNDTISIYLKTNWADDSAFIQKVRIYAMSILPNSIEVLYD